MFSFFLPFWAVSESYNIVYLFSFGRLLVTSIIFIVYSATILARLLNFKTSFLNMKIERLEVQAPCIRKAMRYYLTIPFYHTTIGNFGKALKSDCVFFALYFHLQVHPCFEQSVANLNLENI